MSGQNKLSRGFLLLFSLTLLLAACGQAGINIDVPTEVMTEQPTSIPTETPIPTPTEIPAKEYPITTIENYRDCYVPTEELLDGSYWNWLNDVIAPTLIPWFQEHEGKIKDVRIAAIGLNTGNCLVFNPETAPNFEDPETAPFKRGVTFGHTTWESNGDPADWAILAPIFYYDVETQQVYPILIIRPIGHHDEEKIKEANRIFTQEMNITPILTENTWCGYEIPVVSQLFARVGNDEMDTRFQRFYEGDFSALSGEDMMFFSSTSVFNWYR